MVNWALIVTLSRIALVPVFAFVMFLPIPKKEWLAAAVFCVAASTDCLDGYLARKHNQITKLGILLDPLADKLLVITALVFLIGKGVPKWMAWVLIAREFAVIGLRLIAPKSPISPSFIGKAKTALEMVGIVLIILKFWLGTYILFFAVFFSIVSGIEYYVAARKWFRWRVQLGIKQR